MEPEEKVTLAGLDIDCTDSADFLRVLVRLESLSFIFCVCEHALNISSFLHGRGLIDKIESVRPLSDANLPTSLFHALFITAIFIHLSHTVPEIHAAIRINAILTKKSLASNICPELDLVMFHGIAQSLQTDVITYTLIYDVTCFFRILANSFVS